VDTRNNAVVSVVRETAVSVHGRNRVVISKRTLVDTANFALTRYG